MSDVTEKVPPVQNPRSNTAGVGPVILSSIGMAGWIALLVLLQPYQENTPGDAAAPVVNFFTFGFNFILVIAGSLISGTLSFSGLLTGAIAMGSSRDRLSLTAVVLGLVGLLLGAVILIWRYAVIAS